MSESFTETTQESWFSRIKSSISGMIIGLIMAIVAFPVLFLNEGRAVKTAKSLNEGAAAAIDVPASPVQATNNGKLIHFTGMTAVPTALKDPTFGVEAKALTLSRTVEMYQWKEKSESKSREKLGGGKETVTTYDYQKDWAASPVASNKFKNPTGHENPASFPYQAQSLVAKDVTVGDFKIPERLISGLGGSKPLTLGDEALAAAPGTVKPKIEAGAFYYGENPASPQVGDMRVQFTSLAPTEISVLAAQNGNTIVPYQTKAGRTLEMVQTGSVTADAMFQTARQGNTIMTWALRVGGWLLMFIGLTMIFKPLVIVGKFVPFIGTLIGAGTGLLSLALSGVAALITIALAWIVYRPVLGIALLVAAAALGIFAILRIRARKVHLVPGSPVPAV